MSLILALLLSMGVMLCAWFFYLYTQNPGVVDVFWSLAIFVVGTFYLQHSLIEAQWIMPQLLLFLWAIRLSLFLLLTRVVVGKVEMRYKKISHNWSNQSLGFFYHFLFQAVLAWVIGLPFYFIARCEHFGLFQYIAIVVVIAGLIGETVADTTLHYFVKQKKGKVCQLGLWRYSRHPNYFFECFIWLGFSLMGVINVQSLLGFCSVITLFCVMWFMTIPLTEQQSVERRGDSYIAYQKQVSCFFLWFRR